MEPFLPAPQPVRWRRGVYAAGLVIPFTCVQIWAVLVLLTMANLDGAVAFAMLLTIFGSAVGVYSGWRWAVRLGSEREER
ncbi:hypothetical protein [Amycolatopsis sp. NPDC059657]|uniref:hypothetical protein n=1 Tax=Amycolatopsis sp. NPDC059657 TaxID=3346899 RepID=UPI00366C57AC